MIKKLKKRFSRHTDHHVHSKRKTQNRTRGRRLQQGDAIISRQSPHSVYYYSLFSKHRHIHADSHQDIAYGAVGSSDQDIPVIVIFIHSFILLRSKYQYKIPLGLFPSHYFSDLFIYFFYLFCKRLGIFFVVVVVVFFFIFLFGDIPSSIIISTIVRAFFLS